MDGLTFSVIFIGALYAVYFYALRRSGGNGESSAQRGGGASRSDYVEPGPRDGGLDDFDGDGGE